MANKKKLWITLFVDGNRYAMSQTFNMI